MEVEVEVEVEVSFETWSIKEKMCLIEEIVAGGCYSFIEETVVEIEPRIGIEILQRLKK